MRRASLLIAALFCLMVLTACDPAGGAGSAPLPPRPTATLVPLPTESPASPASSGPQLTLTFRNAAGQDVERTVDGNALRIAATLDAAEQGDVTVGFAMEGKGDLGECRIPAGETSCELPLRADGWAWEAQKQVGIRQLSASVDGAAATASRPLAVVAKPIVLVHGLNSDENSWINWIKPGGYLDAHGLPGYAVDDGQFGTRRMNTGIPSQPTTPTMQHRGECPGRSRSTSRRSAAAHRRGAGRPRGSQPGRAYLAVLRPEPHAGGRGAGAADVPAANQLFMAGTPNGGTPCGRIPAAIGLFSPASTQITPEYSPRSSTRP